MLYPVFCVLCIDAMSRANASAIPPGQGLSMTLRNRGAQAAPVHRMRQPSRSESPTLPPGADTILSVQQLRHLREHKYNVEGEGVLEKLCMQRFWRWLILKVPLWWAPNAMTLSGLVFNLIGTLLFLLYNPDARHTENVSFAFCLCFLDFGFGLLACLMVLFNAT